MKKIRKTIACLITSLMMLLCFSGCEMQFVTATVMSVEKTSTDGLVDTYTITYSDGTQSTFEVTNGQDGKDGENGKDGKDGTDGQDGETAPITVQDLYNEYVARYGENITYAEFLDIYLAVGESEYTAVHKTLLSTAKVYRNVAKKGVYALTFGITTAAQNSKYTYDPQSGYGRITEETLILEVEENSIAQSMGLQVGDILKKLTVNEQEYTLTRYFELSEHRLYIKDGDSVTLTYERGGAERTTTVFSVTLPDLSQIE